MMLSGLRRGELAALTWNDVDLKARTITVNKTIEYDSNGTPTLRHVPGWELPACERWIFRSGWPTIWQLCRETACP